jgi:hypothetical protein
MSRQLPTLGPKGTPIPTPQPTPEPNVSIPNQQTTNQPLPLLVRQGRQQGLNITQSPIGQGGPSNPVQSRIADSVSTFFGTEHCMEIRYGNGSENTGVLNINPPAIISGIPFNPPSVTVAYSKLVSPNIPIVTQSTENQVPPNKLIITQSTQTELTGENPGVNKVFSSTTYFDQHEKFTSPRYAQTYYSDGGGLDPSKVRNKTPLLIKNKTNTTK